MNKKKLREELKKLKFDIRKVFDDGSIWLHPKTIFNAEIKMIEKLGFQFICADEGFIQFKKVGVEE